MYASLLQYMIIMHVMIEVLNYFTSALNLSLICVVLSESECLSLFKTITISTISITSRFAFVSSFSCSKKSG